MENKQDQTYAINLDWFDQNRMSFVDMASRRVCASCRKKLSSGKKETPQGLIKLITECCRKEKDFIHSQQALIESIFRLFLSTGNKPLTAEEITMKVNEQRADNPISVSTESLQRLLDLNRFLGMGPAAGKSKE
ncbi:MAG: hypothetical protein HYY29_06255 [Chloroflexi bacterium]|nr:hypothetical protein [Chloroflexota bacterium]